MCHIYTYYINESALVPYPSLPILYDASYVHFTKSLRIKDKTKTCEIVKQLEIYFQCFKHFQ